MMNEFLVAPVAFLGPVLDFLQQSPYLFFGAILLVTAVALTILSGLIDIAYYLVVIGGIVLVLIGAADIIGLLFLGPGASILV